METRGRRVVCAAVLTGLLVVTSGCTFQSVKPELAVAPVQRYTTFILGEITVGDKTWEALMPHFRKGIVEWMKEKRAFEAVVEAPSAPSTGPAIMLSGMITEVDKGSVALRWIVGMGAGQAKVKGVFEIKDPGGQTLVKFAGRESYLGGVGIGGPGFLDMEDLMKRFGETVAQSALKWSRGEQID